MLLFIIGMFNLNDKNDKYIFQNVLLYKIIEENDNKNKNKYKVVEIQPKTNSIIKYSDSCGQATIYYDIDNINYDEAFYMSNTDMLKISWLCKRNDEHIRTHNFIFETYHLNNVIYYDRMSSIQV